LISCNRVDTYTRKKPPYFELDWEYRAGILVGLRFSFILVDEPLTGDHLEIPEKMGFFYER